MPAVEMGTVVLQVFLPSLPLYANISTEISLSSSKVLQLSHGNFDSLLALIRGAGSLTNPADAIGIPSNSQS